MGGTYSLVKTVVTGETITAADRNNEHTNHIDNFDFIGLGDASDDVAAMQTNTDPYPTGTESLATDGLGELQRIRYMTKQISGEAQWYIDPDANIRTLAPLLNRYQPSLHNMTLTATVSSKDLTVTLKTAAGATPSSTDTPLITFRHTTLTNGTYLTRSITAATSIVLSDGSTLGFTAAEAGRIYVWALDNAGTVELALSRTADIFQESNLVSTTAEGAAGAADSASVMYSTTARTNVPCCLLGYVEIVTGATEGEWDNAPTKVQLMGQGVKRTGETVQEVYTLTGAVATGVTRMPGDDSVPQNNEGDEFMTRAITPTSAINILLINIVFNGANSSGTAQQLIAALFQDTTAGALAAVFATSTPANGPECIAFQHKMVSGTNSSTTLKLRVGSNVDGTITFNGVSSGRIFGGVMASSITIKEIFA